MAVFRSHVDVFVISRYILRLRFWIVFVITRISLNWGPLYPGCGTGLNKIVRYTEDFVIRPLLNRGSTIPGRPISVNNCVRRERKHTNTKIIERVGVESLCAISEASLAIIGVWGAKDIMSVYIQVKATSIFQRIAALLKWGVHRTLNTSNLTLKKVSKN